ncbi:class I SAM-dependent methyltransferase [Aestuariirhabdus sp. Z084]|uniref:class I SAM-dependent methyltransferase n=1 Tax=Aestuariirhabdus haliotis TaxID=2918751 RepID=UPI00201B3D8F|nr:class I SAM-dependent methyltransferase [Aestuariirhabdus haliotis]MCL6415043.1 class I SAM-dependent methyltransferase [Aestuariirhabdus haliotis]MCL6418975.1 class I SAM-dependent methyltransferase [Aestuariirhabdus haliotis]
MSNESSASPVCVLCGAPDCAPFHQDKFRLYLRCPHCYLVQVPDHYHLSAEQERAEYELHNNDPEDPGYRGFLSRLSVPLFERLPGQAEGLDFGCGPGPALARMFEEQGYSMRLFDPFFANHPQHLEANYDFITATEVLEHLSQPAEVLNQLWSILKPGGWLGIMTKLVISETAFANWHYIRDPTHIIFFSQETFLFWGRQHQARVEFIGKDVTLIQKPASQDTQISR